MGPEPEFGRIIRITDAKVEIQVVFWDIPGSFALQEAIDRVKQALDRAAAMSPNDPRQTITT